MYLAVSCVYIDINTSADKNGDILKGKEKEETRVSRKGVNIRMGTHNDNFKRLGKNEKYDEYMLGGFARAYDG